MNDEMWWLKEAIVSYVQTHKNVDSVELVNYIGVRCDVSLAAIKELTNKKVLERYWNGKQYILRIIK